MLAVFGGERRRVFRSDPVKQDVKRRQSVLAHELSPLTGIPPRQLLDYHRADHVLRR